MAVTKKKKKKGWKTGRLHWPGSGGKHEHHPDEAERLTPLEETAEFKKSPQADSDRNADDTIRIDSKSVPMPEHLLEDEREGSSIFRLEPVVLFILLFDFCLSFHINKFNIETKFASYQLNYFCIKTLIYRYHYTQTHTFSNNFGKTYIH